MFTRYKKTMLQSYTNSPYSRRPWRHLLLLLHHNTVSPVILKITKCFFHPCPLKELSKAINHIKGTVMGQLDQCVSVTQTTSQFYHIATVISPVYQHILKVKQ